MPPCPLPPAPEVGQTTLDFSRHTVSLKKPGKRAKPQTNKPLRRSTGGEQWVAGESAHEDLLVRRFAAYQIASYDDDDSDPGGHALHRHSYPRELKLSAIQWAENTWVKGKQPDDPLRRITRYEAAKRLKITQTMLKSWVKNKVKISLQKKGSRRARSDNWKCKEPELEHALFRQFQEGRKLGKAIGAQWFKRHARALY